MKKLIELALAEVKETPYRANKELVAKALANVLKQRYLRFNEKKFLASADF